MRTAGGAGAYCVVTHIACCCRCVLIVVVVVLVVVVVIIVVVVLARIQPCPQKVSNFFYHNFKKLRTNFCKILYMTFSINV